MRCLFLCCVVVNFLCSLIFWESIGFMCMLLEPVCLSRVSLGVGEITFENPLWRLLLLTSGVVSILPYVFG